MAFGMVQLAAGPGGMLGSAGNSGAVAGQGGGAYLLTANMLSPPDSTVATSRTLDRPASSTADAYHMDGLTDFTPIDLYTMGSPGTAIANAKGYRYVWIISCDHPTNGSPPEGGWAYDATMIYALFSNDPGLPPDPSTMRAICPNQFNIPGNSGFFPTPFCSWLMYQPDDPTNPFYLYTEANQQGTGFVNSLNCALWKGANFDGAFSPVSMSHACTNGFGITSFQRVYRTGTNTCESWGNGNIDGSSYGLAKWNSTDGGVTFTRTAFISNTTGGTLGANSQRTGFTKGCGYMGTRFQIGSDWYIAANEDLRGPNWGGGTTYSLNDQACINSNETYKSLSNGNLGNPPASHPAQWQSLGVLGQYVSLVPINVSTGDINFTGTPPIIRLSDIYNGRYPDATYLQYVTNYVEDGIVFVYAVHAMFGDTGLTFGALPEAGGGWNEQYVDLYGYVFDATAAQNSAPAGVKASCAGGVVTLSWHNIPAGRSYRVKRGTSFGTYGTTVGDVAGTTMTDTPTSGSLYYYQVTSLFGGVEKASRVVSVYVS